MRIQPLNFSNKLDWAKGKITTDRGEITAQWKRAAGSFALTVHLPVNVPAQVALLTADFRRVGDVKWH